jgi:uncharacterized membrane protein
MKVLEMVAVVVFTALGLRSAWYWIRRPFASREVADHLLYAMHVTGRVGLWFALAGGFALVLLLDMQVRANEYRWYLLLPGLLAFLQLIAAVLLSRRGDEDAGG